MVPVIPHAGWPTLMIKTWLPEARKSWRLDLIAGLTVWGLVIPESIAYTGLAGVKPSAGIWAIVMVLPFYALFGGSKELVATPTAATAVTAGALIATLAPKDPANAMGTIAIVTGLLFLAAYYFKLGFVVHFISKPINAGFMFGLAVFLTVSQLRKLFGISFEKGTSGADGNTFERGWALLTHLGQTNLHAVGIAVVGLVIMFGLPKIAPRIPAGLVTLVVSTVMVGAFGWGGKDGIVDTVGKIPTGFPSIIAPKGTFDNLFTVVVGAVGIVLLAFSEAASVASELAEDRGHEYNPSNDLFAFGIGNVVSGFFGNLVGAGSMSSSATNVSAGGRTPMASIFTALAALLTGLFAGGLLANLPEATLGVLIIHAVIHHLRLRFVSRIRRFSRAEVVIAILAAFGVMWFDVLEGLLIAMAASLIWYLYRTTQVGVRTLGQDVDNPEVLVADSSPSYRALPENEVALRFSGDLFYGNIDSACERVTAAVDAAVARGVAPDSVSVVVDVEVQTFFDYTTILRVRQMLGQLTPKCATVTLVGVRASLAEDLTIDGPLPNHVKLVRSLNPNDAPIDPSLTGSAESPG